MLLFYINVKQSPDIKETWNNLGWQKLLKISDATTQSTSLECITLTHHNHVMTWAICSTVGDEITRPRDYGIIGKPWWHILEQMAGQCVNYIDFEQKLKRRKMQVTKVLRDPSIPMNWGLEGGRRYWCSTATFQTKELYKWGCILLGS